MYTKRFSNIPPEEIAREINLQRIGADYSLSPAIVDTDFQTFVTMEDLEQMNVADFYGDNIEDVPENLRREIWNTLWILYSCAHIEYLDVTPYNFIEKDHRVWIVDYGHARKTIPGNIDPWLLGVLSNPDMMITEWNSEFA
jgi:tRNA A-37 threonylcarbamoyl transferase component Bud32